MFFHSPLCALFGEKSRENLNHFTIEKYRHVILNDGIFPGATVHKWLRSFRPRHVIESQQQEKVVENEFFNEAKSNTSLVEIQRQLVVLQKILTTNHYPPRYPIELKQ